MIRTVPALSTFLTHVVIFDTILIGGGAEKGGLFGKGVLARSLLGRSEGFSDSGGISRGTGSGKSPVVGTGESGMILRQKGEGP